MPVKSKDLIGGHEGVGIVVAIGEGTSQEVPLRKEGFDESGDIKVGMRVGIRFFAKTCLKCESCRKGFEARKSPPIAIANLPLSDHHIILMSNFRLSLPETQWILD